MIDPEDFEDFEDCDNTVPDRMLIACIAVGLTVLAWGIYEIVTVISE